MGAGRLGFKRRWCGKGRFRFKCLRSSRLALFLPPGYSSMHTYACTHSFCIYMAHGTCHRHTCTSPPPTHTLHRRKCPQAVFEHPRSASTAHARMHTCTRSPREAGLITCMVASAHTVFASSCGRISGRRRYAPNMSWLSSVCGGACRSVASDHSTFARPRASNWSALARNKGSDALDVG